MFIVFCFNCDTYGNGSFCRCTSNSMMLYSGLESFQINELAAG